jgi:hypothetical protein
MQQARAIARSSPTRENLTAYGRALMAAWATRSEAAPGYMPVDLNDFHVTRVPVESGDG